MCLKRTGRRTAVSDGFTIVEVLMASAISTLVLLGAVILFLTYLVDYHDQKLMCELQENMRFAVDAVCRDLRGAGYGLNVRAIELNDWIAWETNFTENPLLVPGDTETDPDRITIAAAFDSDAALIASATSAGDTTLTVKGGKGDMFDKAQHRVVIVGKLETARVVSRSGDSLTISTHPTESGHGLKFPYPGDATVERVETLTYSCEQGGWFLDGVPFLSRDRDLGSLQAMLHNIVAAYVEDMQITRDGYAYVLEITGRTSEPVSRPATADPDGYRRLTVTTRITPRNSSGVLLRNAGGG
jgi:hypothetical protein